MPPRFRKILGLLLLGATLVLLYRVSLPLVRGDVFGLEDFVEYWSAGRLNLQGADPYSPELMLPLQLQVGQAPSLPIMMWNPPWTLPLVMPFGAFNYPLSRLLWFLAQIVLIFFCASYLWKFYQGPPQFHWLAWLIAFTFLPTLMVLKKGQIATVMLLGAVLFLRFSRQQAWWLAALSLFCIAVKPHTLYLLVLAFVLWALYARRWLILAASASGVLLATGIALAFNPLVVNQYLAAVKQHSPIWWATPTIGGTLRYLLGPEKTWLQFLPTFLGAVWCCYYWWQRRRTWNWPEQVPLLVAVSVLTTSYGWTFDYVVLLPVILYVAVQLGHQGLSRATVLVAALYLAIDILAFKWPWHNYFTYVWLAPALAGWYLLSVHLGTIPPHSRSSA